MVKYFLLKTTFWFLMLLVKQLFKWTIKYIFHNIRVIIQNIDGQLDGQIFFYTFFSDMEHAREGIRDTSGLR